MAKYISLTASQKEEIRRLTQLANRRIKATDRAYTKEGKTVLPREVVGDFQVKEKWQTATSPLSRSVKFETKKDYLKQLRILRSFENEKQGIREYTNAQREKTILGIETSIGTDLPDKIVKKINKMSAPKLTEFWNTFSDRASKLGLSYSSNGAMTQAVNEYFNEDLESLLDI